MSIRRCPLFVLAVAACVGRSVFAQEVKYEDVGGIRYQVTRQVVQRQIPVTEMQPQQQTYYRQQVATENVQQQQMYAVPVTQYQLVSTLHGRWNPFVTPYWTHEYQPVTTWQQQMATVQIPVSRASLVPDTRTVQVPVTTYRSAPYEQVTRVPIGASQTFADAKPLSSAPTYASQSTPTYGNTSTPTGAGTYGAASSSTASAAPQPSATLAARPSAPTSSQPPKVAGGTMLESDPPRQASGWGSSTTGGRYDGAYR